MVNEVSEPVATQAAVYLPSGIAILESGPVVVIGPNGSGKTRRSRELSSDREIQVINALRNTRISPQLQAMALQQAKDNLTNHLAQAKAQPYEISSDFDFLLTSLLVEASNNSLEFVRQLRLGATPHLPPPTTLDRIQVLWSRFFPGRTIKFVDYSPIVINEVFGKGVPAEYSAWQMSDGEKAALYLAGRTLNAPIGAVMLIDEPETHFHSLLAAEFWDEIERARPDVRFIYVTHDMYFASSRKNSHVLLASPFDGLTPLDLADDVSDDVAALLLGTASLSFFASRVIFCEGDDSSYDSRLYEAWFGGDGSSVVRGVGSSEMVLRCVTALNEASMTRNLSVCGIIDRDFHPDALLAALPHNVIALGVHEVESLLALPAVVSAVAHHLGRDSFSASEYAQSLLQAYSVADLDKVVVERWKRRAEANVIAVVAGVSAKNKSTEDIESSLNQMFDPREWSWTPAALFGEENLRVRGAVSDTSNPNVDISMALSLLPGKQLLPIAARAVGMTTPAYCALIFGALSDKRLERMTLRIQLRSAMAQFIPHGNSSDMELSTTTESEVAGLQD